MSLAREAQFQLQHLLIMKKKSNSKSAFFQWRILTGLFLVLSSVFVTLIGFGTFSAQAQQKSNIITQSADPLVPVGFDCATIQSLGIHKQENLRAGALMIACGLAQGGGSTSFPFTPFADHLQSLLAPLDYGNADADLITGAEIGTNVTQSETFAAANPDNPNEIVVAYNDSRGRNQNPINISGASYSADGGATFTRLTATGGQSPFKNTLGDPVVLYNRPTGTWFTVWLDVASGGQGLGGYKSATPGDPNSWTHFTVHSNSADDRNSGWADNNPSSPFYGRMYISFNDFNVGGGALKVRYSTDNGLTWANERTVSPTFFRDVQITGDPATGKLFLASMNEMGGGLTNRQNKMYVSSDGGNSWTNTYNGPTFAGPGSTVCASNSYFACMFSGPSFWRHMGWGQPAVVNGIVSYVYDSRNTTNGDAADSFYIRSTDGGVTFSAPFKLNTDATTKRQWQPNISAAADGSLLAVWYDERDATATCVKGSTTVGCYKMYARRSTDNGLTWEADMPFSDVLTPLPGQPDTGIVAEYAGDYDYSFQVGNTHLHPWTDGRVAISGASQQDAFFDTDTAGGGGGENIVLTARQRVKNGKNQVQLTWTPAENDGNIDVLRNGSVIRTVPDNGKTNDNLGSMTGTFTYQVCENDGGGCSNELAVVFP